MKVSLKRLVPKYHDTDSVTFADMQNKFTDNRWLRTPSAKKILNSDDVIIYRHQTSSFCFRILKSGYVLTDYKLADEDLNTVIPAKKDYCYYPIESGKIIKIPASDYAEMSFLNALEMILMFHIERNANARERYRTPVRVDANGAYHKKKEKTSIKLLPTLPTIEDAILDYLEPDTEPDYRTKCKKMLDEAKAHLTEKQIEAFQLYIHENMTQQEIADKLGIARSTVEDRLNGALKKIKKHITK